jgi:hypothetical protein
MHSVQEETVGHIRLGILPRYPKWQAVIGLLKDTEIPLYDLADELSDKVLDGADKVLAGDAAQSCVSYCIWLLAQLTLAARGDNFQTAMGKLGIRVSENTTTTEFLARTSNVATHYLSNLTPQIALNNIAGLALRETLTRTIGIQSQTLFGADLAEVQITLKKYATHAQFSALLHTYFTAFLRRTLRFVIDKEIADHLGPGKRFENIYELNRFDNELERFAGQTTRIVDEFSGGWYSKRVWQQGAIAESDAEGFVHVALKKLRADLDLNEVQ